MSEEKKEMTTYELCCAYRKRVMTRASEVYVYGCWGDDFALKTIREMPDKLKSAKGYQAIDPTDLSYDEMDELGFGRWDHDTEMRLIPLWLLPFLADEFPCGDIGDPEPVMTRREDIDNDHRFGCLSQGVYARKEADDSE